VAAACSSKLDERQKTVCRHAVPARGSPIPNGLVNDQFHSPASSKNRAITIFCRTDYAQREVILPRNKHQVFDARVLKA